MPTTESWVIGVAFVLGLFAVAIALWKIRGALDGTSERPVPWASDEPFASPAPERSDDRYPMSGTRFAERVSEAGSTARSEGSVEAGMRVARPFLRRALVDALARGHEDREVIEQRVEAGEWTEDTLAASALSASVSPPPQSLRRRLEAWLFPEREVRERCGHAMNAVARTAEGALTTVPGQHAPRTAPVLQPNLEDLSRGADDKLQEAADPDVVARGPGPRSPDSAEDEALAGEAGREPVADGVTRAPTAADEFLDPLGDGFAPDPDDEDSEDDGGTDEYGADPGLDALDEEVSDA